MVGNRPTERQRVKEEGGREVRREKRKNKLTTMMDDKEIGEGLFEAENGNLKKKKRGKKTQTICGQRIVHRGKRFSYSRAKCYFHYPRILVKKKHTFHYPRKASYTKLYKILNIS